MGALGTIRRWLARLTGGPAPAGPGGDHPGTTASTTTTGPGAPATSTTGTATATPDGPGRISGEPTSSNGASSFHLFWELPGELVAVAATFEVRESPKVDRLYFWALQAGFSERGRRGGAGHLGLQFHPDCPDRTAANWGGYDESGRILDGTASLLPSSIGNPHTRDFDWRAGRRYRLSIEPAPAADQPDDGRTAWRGTITDLGDGSGNETVTVVRDLLARGDRLTQPMVWSEVFARCEQPAAEVRWSDLVGTSGDGETVRPTAVRVNYQAHTDGGCANTNSWLDGAELVQRTGTARSTPAGARLALPEGTSGLG